MQGFQEFTQVNNPLTGTRISALYNTLEQLMADKAMVIRGFDIKMSKNSQHPAFFIAMKETPKHNLFAARKFRFKEAHLTLEKYFKGDSSLHHGLTIAHYTETYTSSDGQSQIVVHYYFNRYAEFHSAEIKEYQGDVFVKIPSND